VVALEIADDEENGNDNNDDAVTYLSRVIPIIGKRRSDREW
jgi:hypothetical protein